MTLEMNRPKCCCFTGHRENKLKRSEKEILEDLKQAINQAIDDGYSDVSIQLRTALGSFSVHFRILLRLLD